MMKCKRRFVFVLMAAALTPSLAVADGVQFDFTASDLSATFGSGTLEYANGATTSDAVSFGTASSFGIPALPGGDADVLSFPAFAQDQGLLLDSAAGPNGEGSYINQYTMIWDLLIPDVGANWTGLYNTSASNSNDGEFFIRTDGGIGISGVYEGTINSNQWHRIAMVWDVASMYKYIDGQLVGSQTDISGVDGRWSLYPTGGAEKTYVLSDNDGDTNSGYVGSFYFIDEALSADAIAALGGATAAGIVPEPATLTMLLAGMFCAMLAARLRRTS